MNHEKRYFRYIKRYDIGARGGSSIGGDSSLFTCAADTRESWLVQAVAVVAVGAALHCRLNLHEIDM